MPMRSLPSEKPLMAPFDLMRADLSGTEYVVGVFTELTAALTARDLNREAADRYRVHYRVIDRDDPERGELDEWEGDG